ncbi:protein phosphatase 2, regulatory subunit B', epsilon isoform a [Reticulomyxa filosa]|uniref:Protein phosphatase 2, regulatory subunit B', epsilon isoform a n=1 Tax=Reticulomyxa filosa TaxID=46433 RepID=X6N2I9_RETFI|nr:protein phosphatase 2, regulatory subunit B', epsilon isoform a [Reticulomyxa filosa]|eukprot:ETO20475.1 protein phosphatase 2, regulatory subunit B', epsilon isoform a [Reticulomyxa filosa]
MRKYLEGKFINNVIELFVSEDLRERECLKTILHRVYGRFMSMRFCIRALIANMCYRTIYGDRTENGIPEFLEIFCSIIHGFTVPVKKEHKQFLRTVLIPLHKYPYLEKFHEQLVACCVRFVLKDPTIGPMFWPVRSPSKEEMFIAEVANVINAMINDSNELRIKPHQQILFGVIDQLVRCMKSKHHSVAERAILIWSEEAMEILVDMDKASTWPKIIAAFIEVEKLSFV